MSSPSLRPLIDTCQKCSTSPANHEPRSPANRGFQNPGVCPQAVPSFPSPTPTILFLALAPFSAQAKYRKPRSSVFPCSQTLRKRLLRRLPKQIFIYKCKAPMEGYRKSLNAALSNKFPSYRPKFKMITVYCIGRYHNSIHVNRLRLPCY